MAYNPKSLQNLKRGNKATQFQAGQQQVEISRAGGKAVQAEKRKRTSMAFIARQIADAPAQGKAKDVLGKLGVADEDQSCGAAVVAGLYNKALSGDDKAFTKWQELTEAQNKDEKPFELPARVIGKAFVDINRDIMPNIKYVFKGGRGSTKSSFVSLKVIELLKNNPNIHACVVRKVASTLKDSVYSQIKWAIHELGLDDEFRCKSNPLEIEYKATGQIIYFRGCDDPIKLKSIKPTFGYIGILWIEERDQLAGDAEERNVKQSVLRGGDIAYEFLSYNPPKSRESWVNKELLEVDPKRVVHASTYLDVPPAWLGTKFLDDAEHLKQVNPDAYEHEYMGVANGDGGAVFENIEIRTITDEEIQWFDHIYMGVDWGWYPDPFAFIRLHYDRRNETIYLLDEIYVNKVSNEMNAHEILSRGYTDAYVTCDSAEKKSIADFRACGVQAKEAVKGPGSVDYGLKWMQSRKLVIDRNRTPNALKEFMEYEYERDRNDNVISGFPDKNNHIIDATRYALERVWRSYWSLG